MKYKVNSISGYGDLIQMYKPEKTTTFACLVYGLSGSGKTTFASSFPEPFFVDADRGMRSVQKELPRLQLQDTDTPFSLIFNLLSDALYHRGPFASDGVLGDRKTIVIDSITSLIDDYLAPETMAEAHRNILTEKLSYDEYGKIQSRMTALSSLLKDLSHEFWIVTTALVEEEKDEASGRLAGKPKLTGKYRDKIMADYDETYFLEKSVPLQGPPEYLLYTEPHLWYQAKSRLLKPVKVIKDPSYSKLVELMK